MKKSSILLIICLQMMSSLVQAELDFDGSVYSLSNSDAREVSLGDIDNDGDLDIVVATFTGNDLVWHNNGSEFNLAQNVVVRSQGVKLADINRDGFLDYVSSWNGSINIILNDGQGFFTEEHQVINLNMPSLELEVADLDQNGWLDIVTVNGNSGPTNYYNTILYSFEGKFSYENSIHLTDRKDSSFGVSSGDLNNDGLSDIVIANNYNQENIIRLNDGQGGMIVTQVLEKSNTHSMALGDLDGDGDLDIYEANLYGSPDKIWLNDGTGTFVDSGQRLGASDSAGVDIGDIDNDGDLDVVVANLNQDGSNVIWLNNGQGVFDKSTFSFGQGRAIYSGMGDLDGDGDLDIVIANINSEDEIWINESVFEEQLVTLEEVDVILENAVEDTLSICREDPEACGIIDSNGSTDQGIQECTSNPEEYGLFNLDDLNGAQEEGRLIGVEEGIQSCKTNPETCDLFDQNDLEEAYEIGVTDGNQQCIDDPAYCGLFDQTDVDNIVETEKTALLHLIVQDLPRGIIVSRCKKNPQSPLCEFVDIKRDKKKAKRTKKQKKQTS